MPSQPCLPEKPIMVELSLEQLQSRIAELEERCRAAEDAQLAAVALAESAEARFRYLADQAPVMIWMSGLDKARYHFNVPWLEFRGHSLDHELGNGWTQGIHSDDLPAFLDSYHRSFEARAPFSVEYRLLRHDGEYRWVQDAGRPTYSSAGEFEGYVGSCIDITSHRQNEEQVVQLNRELTRQIEDFQILVDTLPLGVTVAQDPNCEHVWINVACAELMQLPPDANASFTHPASSDFAFKFCRNG